MLLMELRNFVRPDGRSPFEEWFASLHVAAAAKVTVSLARLERGNVSNVKSVGSGVLELRIHWGPGYRVYFGRDGERLTLLLCGGSKRRQEDDIAEAHGLWAEYKPLKRSE
jgi:putative addiction module killer protein